MGTDAWDDIGMPLTSPLRNQMTSLIGLTILSDFSHMRRLDLSKARIADLGQVSKISGLQSLDVSFTEVRDLEPISGLTKLKELSIERTLVSQLQPLKPLTCLTSLNLSRTQVSDLDPIIGLTQLRRLNIAQTAVPHLGCISHLTLLEDLDAYDTVIEEITPLWNHPSLRKLGIDYTNVTDLGPICGVTTLEYLDATCTGISDLEPLQNLTGIETLYLSSTRVSDLSPIARFPHLRYLDVSFTEASVLKPHRNSNLLGLDVFGTPGLHLSFPELVESNPRLRELSADRLEGVPREILSDSPDSSCLDDVRIWHTDCQAGAVTDREIKVFVLGNGRAGKTQICRALLGEAYDETVPSTHGVQVGQLPISVPGLPPGDEVLARLWDFGGQDIYHGTHALFLEGRAVFVIVWSPDVEGKGQYVADGLPLHHHPLDFWLDYVNSLAGRDAAVVLVQAKCDAESQREEPKLPAHLEFTRPIPRLKCSAAKQDMGELHAHLASATRYLLEKHGTYTLPTPWVKVREQLRQRRDEKKQRILGRDEFDQLCTQTHATSVPKALLNYFHRTGEVYWREELFQGQIVLDQQWALRAIYAVFDRDGLCQDIRQDFGTFRRSPLHERVWKDEFTEMEQRTLLDMMESCFICFPLEHTWNRTDPRYAVPDLLPDEAAVQGRIASRWRTDLPSQELRLEYAFLHEGIARKFLCQIGTLAGYDAVYWRYGCCFYDAKTGSRAMVRALRPSPDQGGGSIHLQTCDGRAEELLTILKDALLNIRIGQPPKIVGNKPERDATHEPTETKPLAETLDPAPVPTDKPVIYFSYAWGEPDDERQQLVERLEKKLQGEGYEVRRDKTATRPGDWISEFMSLIESGERVCVVLSPKYLESKYCMTELLGIFEYCGSKKKNFLDTITALIAEKVSLTWAEDRLKYVRYWKGREDALEALMVAVGPKRQGDSRSELMLISRIGENLHNILDYIRDVIMPRGLEDIEENDFQVVVEALKRKGA